MSLIAVGAAITVSDPTAPRPRPSIDPVRTTPVDVRNRHVRAT